MLNSSQLLSDVQTFFSFLDDTENYTPIREDLRFDDINFTVRSDTFSPSVNSTNYETPETISR